MPGGPAYALWYKRGSDLARKGTIKSIQVLSFRCYYHLMCDVVLKTFAAQIDFDLRTKNTNIGLRLTHTKG